MHLINRRTLNKVAEIKKYVKSGISILEFTTNVLNINWQTIAGVKIVSVLAKNIKSSSTASKSCHSRQDAAQNRSLCCEREV